MDAREYQELAMKTEASQYEIWKRIIQDGSNPTLEMTRLDTAVRGLAGDVGEVCSCVQKYIEYGEELDEINLKEEVGDCMWRLAQICKAIGIDLEDAMIANIEKLKIRYPDKYSDERAAESRRDRKAERRAVTFDPRSKQGVRDLTAANIEKDERQRRGYGFKDLAGANLEQNEIVCEECRTSYLKCCAPCLAILIGENI